MWIVQILFQMILVVCAFYQFNAGLLDSKSMGEKYLSDSKTDQSNLSKRVLFVFANFLPSGGLFTSSLVKRKIKKRLKLINIV